MSRRWTLPGDFSAAAVARAHVHRELADWPNVADIELAASELTANAVEYSDPPIELVLDITGTGARVSLVSTSTFGVPTPQSARPEENRGRGLALVAVLADRWGWHRDQGRLAVWADFPIPDDFGR